MGLTIPAADYGEKTPNIVKFSPPFKFRNLFQSSHGSHVPFVKSYLAISGDKKKQNKKTLATSHSTKPIL